MNDSVFIVCLRKMFTHNRGLNLVFVSNRFNKEHSQSAHISPVITRFYRQGRSSSRPSLERL